MAGVVSLDVILPLWLCCHVPGIDIHHPQAAYAPAVMELHIPCRMNTGFLIILSKSVSHYSSSSIFVLPRDHHFAGNFGPLKQIYYEYTLFKENVLSLFVRSIYLNKGWPDIH